MKISIIMPTYNKLSRLSLSLKSLCEQTMSKEDFQVVLVDDGSSMDVHSLYEAYASQMNIKLIRIEHLGRSVARNTAIEHADGELIVFTDDDAICDYDFLKKHWEHHLKYKDSVLLGKRKKVFWVEESIKKLESDEGSCMKSVGNSRVREDTYEVVTRKIFHGTSKCLYDIVWICSITANMSVPKSYLMEIGKFETIYQCWGLEDIDLGYRLKQYGLDFYYDANILNYHMEHSRNRKQMLDDIVRNMRLFYSKYKDPFILDYWKFFKGDIGIMELVLRTEREESLHMSIKEMIPDEKLNYFNTDFLNITID